MAVHNLDALFQPDAIALICSGSPSEVIIARNLMNAGFRGPVMPVDPARRALEGALAYPDVASLPLPPALAVITSPVPQAPALLRQLGQRGARAAVIVSETQVADDGQREALHRAVADAARPYGLRVLGPDCGGLSVPIAGLNASLSRFPPTAGQTAFVTQSSAIAQTALDWGNHQGFGFSYLIHSGIELDVDIADILDYLTGDYRTRAILLYLEHIRDARKFMSAARRAARIKPVIVLKPHRYREDKIDDAVHSAAFQRAGALRVEDWDELFDLVEALGAARLVRNDRLAIISNSHSLSVLARDTLYYYDGRLAQFAGATQEGLETLIEPAAGNINPVELGNQADAAAYGKALELVLQDPGVDGVVVIKAPSALSEALPVAEAMTQRLPSRRFLLASFPGPAAGAAARRLTAARQIPTYDAPDAAVRTFMRIVQYKRNQQLLMETPPSMPEEFTPYTEAARHIIRQALAEGRDRLNEFEAMQLLAAYCIPVVDTYIAHSPVSAAEFAARLERPVALKVLSPEIENKSQIGGVARYLDNPAAVRQAADAMLIRLRNLAPAARIDGFLIQPMAYRDGAYEMVMGIRPGGHFGPLIYFGQGGTEAEVIDDIAYGLPPLNMHLAREIMARTRIFQRLRFSLLRRADLNGLALTLVKVAQIVIELGEVAELEINPLRVSAQGVLALDARVRIEPGAGEAAARLAIRPYPKELEEKCKLPNGRELLLRPILPEDEPALQALAQRASPEDLRLRFFQPIRELSHDMAARLTQIDYNREMALVAVEPGIPGKAEMYGVVNLSADPDNEKAEYSIIVDRALMRVGLGTLLMNRILDYARGRGIREVYGEVLQENEPMLQLNRALGFAIRMAVDDPGLRHVTLRL